MTGDIFISTLTNLLIKVHCVLCFNSSINSLRKPGFYFGKNVVDWKRLVCDPGRPGYNDAAFRISLIYRLFFWYSILKQPSGG